MIIFVLILLIIIISKASLRTGDDTAFHYNYLSKEQTTAINGIFVIMVLIGHFQTYVEMGGLLDEWYLVVFNHLNQMVVATFLFYSGFGMMEATKKKGDEYINKIPEKFVKLLLRVDVAVVLFLIVDYILGIHYPIKQVLLAFVCWSNIGNSNWYIFVILSIYIAMFTAFKIVSRISDKKAYLCIGLSLLFIFTAILVRFLINMEMGWYWYDTAILFPVGCLYSLLRKKIEAIVMRNNVSYLTALTLMLGVYVLSYFRRFDYGVEGYTVWACSFIGLVLLITMKVEIKSNLLTWFGQNVFNIYMLQRIPMIILNNLGFMDSHKYMCLIIVFVVTALIAAVFDEFVNRTINRISLKYGKVYNGIHLR